MRAAMVISAHTTATSSRRQTTDHGQQIEGVATAGTNGVGVLDIAGDALLGHPLQGLEDEVDSGVEVVEEGAVGDARAAADLGDGRTVVADVVDRRDGGVEEQLDSLGAAFGLRATPLCYHGRPLGRHW